MSTPQSKKDVSVIIVFTESRELNSIPTHTFALSSYQIREAKILWRIIISKVRLHLPGAFPKQTAFILKGKSRKKTIKNQSSYIYGKSLPEVTPISLMGL